jgi:hypothetical protein
MLSGILLIIIILIATVMVLGSLLVICIILEELREFYEEYQWLKEWREK